MDTIKPSMLRAYRYGVSIKTLMEDWDIIALHDMCLYGKDPANHEGFVSLLATNQGKYTIISWGWFNNPQNDMIAIKASRVPRPWLLSVRSMWNDGTLNNTFMILSSLRHLNRDVFSSKKELCRSLESGSKLSVDWKLSRSAGIVKGDVPFARNTVFDTRTNK